MPSSAAVRTSLRLAARCNLGLPLRVAQRQLDSDLAEDRPGDTDVRGGADGHLRDSQPARWKARRRALERASGRTVTQEEEEGIFGGMTVPARMTVG